MTIAAGFIVSNGVLLCADSQYTIGSSITYGNKVIVRELGGARAVFAIAGHVDYGRMFTDFCGDLYEASDDKSVRALRAITIGALSDFQTRYPVTATDDCQVSFLIGLWAEGEKAQLFRANRDALSVVDEWDCMGFAPALGKYLFGSIYERGLSLDSAAILAAQVLADIKQHDTYVGGPSNLVLLFNDGRMGRPNASELEIAENYRKQFLVVTHRLLEQLSNFATSDEFILRSMHAYTDAFSRIRTEWRQDIEEHRRRLPR